MIASISKEGILISKKLHTIIALVSGVGGDGKVLTILGDMAESIGNIEIIKLGVWIP